ncbi:MAG: Flp family type IVb pilin [Burkholderiaceae bacterium]|nr:Flp family type IVb pilin [Burkholderiaceae bacterium]
MNALKKKVQAFLADEQGATAVEYGMMVALIAAIIVGTVALIGQNLGTAFTTVLTALTGG